MITSQRLMTRGNTSDFIGHPLPKDSISAHGAFHHAWAPAPHHQIRRWWALWHQRGAQYSAVECTKARVAVRGVFAPAPHPVPPSRLRSATCDVSFLRSDSRRRRYVSDLPNVTPRYLGSEQKGRVSCWSWLSSHV